MQQTGEYRIEAPRETVWQALNDPEVLGACIAGCESVTRVDDEHFDLDVKAKIGPVSAKFAASLSLSELDPPAGYVIEGSVKGGAAGFAKGRAEVALAEADDATLLTYTVDASVGGKLAQIGSRLVDGAARKMADDFFAALPAQLDASAATRQEAEPAVADEPDSRQWKFWALGAVAVAVALVLVI